MNIREAELPGIKIFEPQVFGDHRGFFMEIYESHRYERAGIPATFVQDNVSFSAKAILRGLHFQNPNGQGKLITVMQGEIYDVAVDIRRDSPTFGKWFGMFLNSESKRQLWIPPGFAHGFQVTSDTALVMYKCTEFYRPESEKILLWSDPDLEINWPIRRPELSAKDRNAIPLRNFAESDLPRL